MKILRPFATALCGFAIAALVLYVGFPIEQRLLATAGVEFPDWGADWLTFSPLTFVLLVVAAILCGLVSGVRPLTMGQAPLRSGAIGLVLGVAFVAIATGVSIASGNGKIVQGSAFVGVPALATGTAIFLVQSLGEEAFFRGWLLPALARHWRWPIAIVASSLIFVAAHNLGGLFGGEISLAGLHAGANNAFVNVNLFLGGMTFALLYRVSGGIVAPTLFHFAWNWSDYLFFGLTPNPGKLSFGALIDVDLAGAAQLGGIADGMMANIFATIILAAIVVSLVLFLRREARPAPPKVEPSPKPQQAAAAVSAVAAPVAPVALKQPAEAVAPVPAVVPEPPSDHTIFMPGSALNDAIAASKSASPEPVAAPAPKDRDAEITIPSAPLPAAETVAIPEGGRILTGTHEGCVREINEDRFIAKPETGLFAVADGMGGHKFGDRASTMIIEYLDKADTSTGIDSRIGRVTGAIADANRAIFDEAQTNGSRMGSTIVALMTEGNRFAVVWAGDSRAYRLRGGRIERLTKDHTQVQEMVDKGLLAPEDVARHPMSHVLVRAVGVNPDIDLDEASGTIEKGDVYFLCSDGIYDVLEEDEIGALLEKAASTEAMEKMIKMSLDLGARDNVTGIIVVPDAAA